MPRGSRSSAGVTATELAKHLGLSKQRVGQMASEGILQFGDGKRFDQDASRIRYIHWLRDDRRSTRGEAASRVSEARAREIELRIAKEERRLIDIRESEAVLDEIVGILKSGCLSLPARCTRDLELRRKIEAEVDLVFAKTSDTLQQRSDELRANGEAHVPAEEVE